MATLDVNDKGKVPFNSGSNPATLDRENEGYIHKILRTIANSVSGTANYSQQIVLNPATHGTAYLANSSNEWQPDEQLIEAYRKASPQNQRLASKYINVDGKNSAASVAETLAATAARTQGVFNDIDQWINGTEQTELDKIANETGRANGFNLGSAILDTGIIGAAKAAAALNPLLGAAVYGGGKLVKGSLEAGNESGNFIVEQYMRDPNLFRDPEKLRNVVRAANQQFIGNAIPDTALGIAGDFLDSKIPVTGLGQRFTKNLVGAELRENIQRGYQTATRNAVEKTYQSGNLSWENFWNNLTEEYRKLLPYTDENGTQHSGYLADQAPEVSASTAISTALMTVLGLRNNNPQGNRISLTKVDN